MRKIIAALALVLLFACTKDQPLWVTENLNGNRISVFGHAGMGIAFKYPINSYESFEPCFRIGAEGSEMDVQMTKDSVLVLFHDLKLQDGSLCQGIIHEKNWEEMKDCLHACPYSNSVNIITASWLLDHIDRERIVTFDCKLYRAPNDNYEQYVNTYANALIRLTNNYGIQQKTFVESNDTFFLRILKNKDPELKLFIYPTDFESALSIANKMNLYGITISNEQITKEQVKRAHDAGRRVTVWNVKTEKENLEAVQKSVDFIQSDRIIHLLKMFGLYKKQGIKNFKW